MAWLISLPTRKPHAQRRGLAITATFSDNDISATYGTPRPGYTAMMEAAARGEFDVILVFHTSRLWRNRKERAEGSRSFGKPVSRSRRPRGRLWICRPPMGAAWRR